MDLCVCCDVPGSVLPPPSGVEAEPVNETAIELSWRPASSVVGPVTAYTVLYTAFVSAATNLSRLSPDDPTTSSLLRYPTYS